MRTPTLPAGAGRAASSRAAAPGGGPISGRLFAGTPGLAPGAAPGGSGLDHGLWPLQGLSCGGPCSLKSRHETNQPCPQWPPSAQSLWWLLPHVPLRTASPHGHFPLPPPPNPPPSRTPQISHLPLSGFGGGGSSVSHSGQELPRSRDLPGGRWNKFSCLEELTMGMRMGSSQG